MHSIYTPVDLLSIMNMCKYLLYDTYCELNERD